MTIQTLWAYFLSNPTLVYLAGILSCWLFSALVLPDRSSNWLHSRRNTPTVLMPLGVIALLVAIIAIILGIAQAMAYITVHPAVFILLAIGVIILLAWYAARSR